MKTYEVLARVTISIYTKIEASSEEEALEIAKKRGDILHEHFEHADSSEVWCAGDYDGVPTDIRIETEN